MFEETKKLRKSINKCLEVECQDLSTLGVLFILTVTFSGVYFWLSLSAIKDIIVFPWREKK